VNTSINRFDSGPASYFYDLLEVSLLTNFKAEVIASYAHYVKLSSDGVTLGAKAEEADLVLWYGGDKSKNDITVANPMADAKGL